MLSPPPPPLLFLAFDAHPVVHGFHLKLLSFFNIDFEFPPLYFLAFFSFLVFFFPTTFQLVPV